MITVVICHTRLNKYMKMYDAMTFLELNTLKESLIIHFDISWCFQQKVSIYITYF